MKRAFIIFLILLLATMLIPFSAVIRDKQQTNDKAVSPLLAATITVQKISRQGTDPCPMK